MPGLKHFCWCIGLLTINQGKIIILGLEFVRFYIQVYLKILRFNRQRFILWMFYHCHFLMSVPWIRWLVTCHSHWTSGFNPRPVQVGFVVDRVALGNFFPVCFAFLSLLHPHSFIYFSQLDLVSTYEYWIISSESSSPVLIAWFQSKESVCMEFWRILCYLVLWVLCRCSAFH
jgi:hypothetical protein